MIRVSGYALRKRADGSSFVTLELTGGLELVQSQTTGKFYGTVRKCNVPATFPEEVAKTFVGQTLEGDIVRVQVEPYQFLNPRTGELMMLSHSYAYRPKGSMELTGVTPVEELA